MDGFINVLKPTGMTSHDVIAWLRKLFRYRKIGHAGTLDPNVAGVLLIALGNGTRLLEFLLNSNKMYRCETILGRVSSTHDLYGEVLEKREVSQDLFQRAPEILKGYQGEIEQVPPMVSAVHFQGKRLHELARAGKEVERPARKVNIYHLDIIKNYYANGYYKILFNLVCSKGTYVRTLCHDFGQKLGCGAVMSFLVRTGTAQFKLDGAWTLEEIEKNWRNGEQDFLIPIDKVLELPQVTIKKELVPIILNGGPIILSDFQSASFQEGQSSWIQLKDEGKLIALGKITVNDQKLIIKPKKVLK